MAALLAAAFCWLHPQPQLVSWYGGSFHGRLTASGSIFDCRAMTAASPDLPFGSRVLVAAGSRSVLVTITDRGPFRMDSAGAAVYPLSPHPTRGMDLSTGAAKRLHLIGEGVSRVQVLGVWR